MVKIFQGEWGGGRVSFSRSLPPPINFWSLCSIPQNSEKQLLTSKSWNYNVTNINIVKQFQFSVCSTDQIKLKKLQAEFCILSHSRYFAKKDKDLFLYVYRYHVWHVFNSGMKLKSKICQHYFLGYLGHEYIKQIKVTNNDNILSVAKNSYF